MPCLAPEENRALGRVEPLAGLTPALSLQPSVYELIRAPDFARLPLVVEDFVKDSGAGFSGEPKLVPLLLDLWGCLPCLGLVF